ncbi:hypothetical protein [Nocardia sp. CA-145437]|uniref:hypothetical protein n=1 Tax=Nocardia sp. CA-145437 TaxID=3239980 RepID=UPI003D97673E
MIIYVGGLGMYVPFPRRIHAGWFAIGCAAVLTFAVTVMLVVAAGCGTRVSTEPGPPPTPPPVALVEPATG